MSLRTTRQQVELLGPGEQNLRVTRQQVEVLGSGTKNLRVTRQQVELLLTESRWWRNVSNSLSFSEVAGFNVDRNPHIYDTLTFAERLPCIFNLSIEDTLTLDSSASRCQVGDATDSLVFEDTPWNFLAINDFWPTGDYLDFTETVDIECGNWKHVQQSLSFVSTVDWLGPRYEEINNYISFGESVWNSNSFHIAVIDLLTYLSLAGRPYEVSISDSITFTEDGRRRVDIIDVSLTFNHYALNGKGGDTSDALTFSQTVNCLGSFTRVIDELLNIGHSVTYYLITPCILKQYHPFVGESTVINQPDTPNSTAPLVQQTPSVDRFQLFYPAMGGATDQVVLRAPELDSKDSNSFNRINRETRGGRLIVFADPTWPKVNTISCTFTGLTKTEINTLQGFILNHIGEEIRVIDWEGRGWIGVVIKPNDPATCDGKNKWSIGFEFEGILLDYYSPGLSLLFMDTASNVVLRRPHITDSLVFNQEATVLVL
jgi:hypothetical protein